jgi:hypothetical protein
VSSESSALWKGIKMQRMNNWWRGRVGARNWKLHTQKKKLIILFGTPQHVWPDTLLNTKQGEELCDT